MKPFDHNVRQYIVENLWNFPEYQRIVDLLRMRVDPGEAYVVGGAIRNSLLSRSINDIDLFMLSDAFDRVWVDLESFFTRIEVGALGSPRCFLENGKYYDIVRIEEVDHGFGLCSDIHQCLEVFDFTGNAIAYDLITEKIEDPLGGVADLYTGLLRATRFDFPNTAMRDYLPKTWLCSSYERFLKYSRQLDLRIEPKTQAWMNSVQESCSCKDYGDYGDSAYSYFSVGGSTPLIGHSGPRPSMSWIRAPAPVAMIDNPFSFPSS